ncbi:hypothetical protein PENPOL_c007G09929 [Penicillium polonicum]|uniref:Myb-like DNA-binding domain-containing protein n=1 Tax=Penicillium polonicum TaxID=60169 RepID=A0A1V6NJH0_PENPO|nr:hypothetical protein PENPOL_c007G09929 [Penicillium polonicum]
MAPPEKKGKEPMKTVRQSKVKRAMGQRATQKRTFTKNEIFLYHAIKNGGAKFDHDEIGKALGKSKDAACMQMSRLLNDIREFIKNQKGLVQSDQPEREKIPSNQEGPKNATRTMIPL